MKKSIRHSSKGEMGQQRAEHDFSANQDRQTQSTRDKQLDKKAAAGEQTTFDKRDESDYISINH